jgi:hypothetical protein
MMETSPAAPFVVAKPDLLLEVLVVALALTPLMVAALLPGSTYRHLPVAEGAGRLCVAAICFAHMFQSGMVRLTRPILRIMSAAKTADGVQF